MAEFAGTPLRRDRPLWELLVVEGLAGGRMAVVVKVHHAVADGPAAVALLHSVVRGIDRRTPPDPSTRRTWRPEPIPDRRQLLRMAVPGPRDPAAGMPRLVGPLGPRGAGLGAAPPELRPSSPPLPLDHVPRTSLNVSLTAERTFAMTTLPLEDLRPSVGPPARPSTTSTWPCAPGPCGVTSRTGASCPPAPLVASVPVSTDPNVARLQGNRVDNLYV